MYTAAYSQPISLMGGHCSGACSIDAVLAVSLQQLVIRSSRQ